MITPGSQPFYLPGGPFGCILIHNFTCGPHEMRWLGNHLNEAGYSVLAIRLFGHATFPKDLHRTRFQDWIANMEDGFTILQQRCEKLVAVGISMGGALALIAGAKLSVDGVITIATPYTLPIFSRTGILKVLVWLLQLMGLGKRSIIKSPFSHELDAILPPDRLSYPAFPPKAILEVDKLFTEMQRILPHVSVPTLLINGESDQDDEARSASRLLDHLGTRRTTLMRVKPSLSREGRVQVQERISAAIIQFIANLSGSQP